MWHGSHLKVNEECTVSCCVGLQWCRPLPVISHLPIVWGEERSGSNRTLGMPSAAKTQQRRNWWWAEGLDHKHTVHIIIRLYAVCLHFEIPSLFDQNQDDFWIWEVKTNPSFFLFCWLQLPSPIQCWCSSQWSHSDCAVVCLPPGQSVWTGWCDSCCSLHCVFPELWL